MILPNTTASSPDASMLESCDQAHCVRSLTEELEETVWSSALWSRSLGIEESSAPESKSVFRSAMSSNTVGNDQGLPTGKTSLGLTKGSTGLVKQSEGGAPLKRIRAQLKD